MTSKSHAGFLVLMMATMCLAGCFGGDDEGPNEDETPVVVLDDEWQVHFAESALDLPECNEDRFGWLYYVSADQNFRFCSQFGWELIDVTGPAGADGSNGADGQDGVDGTNGVDGQDGTSILINVINSTACVNGGNIFEIGSDEDGDGILSVTEVHITVDICDGAQGPEGPQGPAGADGQDGADGTNGADGADGLNALVSMTSEAAGSNCANGGTRIDVGIDDNSNGQLETTEIDQTQYVCDGGSTNNTLLTSISSPPTIMGCEAGGRVVSHGLDNGDGGGTYANGVLEAGEVDASTTFCSRYVLDDDNLRMVKDIYSGSGDSSPFRFKAVGNTLYFVANDGINGKELWKTDGTASGTVMIKDINSGSSSSDPSYLVAFGNTLYFRADDGTNGSELWKSDGTASGTVMVKDIISGGGQGYPSYLTAIGNTLYFRADDGTNGVELWKSDGTASGTVMVKDINSGSGSSNINYLVAVGNTLYFRANDGTNGSELWTNRGVVTEVTYS